MTPQNENWSEYRRLILKSLEETKEDIDDIKDDLGEVHTKLATITTTWADRKSVV